MTDSRQLALAALKRQLVWHEARRKELSKSGRSHGAIGWEMLEHSEEIHELTEVIAAIEADTVVKVEPIAWLTPDGEGFRIRFTEPTQNVPMGWDALYAQPVLKVLSDEEICDIQYPYNRTTGFEWLAFARAIEVALKEKS